MSAQKLRSSTGPSSCAIDVSIRGAPTSLIVSSRSSSACVAHRLLELADAAHPQFGVGRPVGVVEGAARRLDRQAHVIGARIGGDAEHLFGGRVDGLECARAAGDELAVDEQPTLAIGRNPIRTPVFALLDNCPTVSSRTIAPLCRGQARQRSSFTCMHLPRLCPIVR